MIAITTMSFASPWFGIRRFHAQCARSSSRWRTQCVRTYSIDSSLMERHCRAKRLHQFGEMQQILRFGKVRSTNSQPCCHRLSHERVAHVEDEDSHRGLRGGTVRRLDFPKPQDLLHLAKLVQSLRATVSLHQG